MCVCVCVYRVVILCVHRVLILCVHRVLFIQRCYCTCIEPQGTGGRLCAVCTITTANQVLQSCGDLIVSPSSIWDCFFPFQTGELIMSKGCTAGVWSGVMINLLHSLAVSLHEVVSGSL